MTGHTLRWQNTLQWRGKYLEMHRRGTWEFAARVGHIDAAVILAVTDAREIVLVEQYRHAHAARTIELPAGLIGDTGADDSAFAAAARELAEETGFEARDWHDLGRFATSPGMTAETFHLFRASGLTRTGAGGGGDGEDIAVHLIPVHDVPAFIARQRSAGRVIDCRLIVAMGLL